MSTSRSKSKDKKAAGKEQPKPSTKPTVTANTGGNAPSSGYNPLLGTFHSLETAPVSSVPHIHTNGRFHDIDDTDDPNYVHTGVEYDCASNNGSWSGESEDPKDKPTHGPTTRHDAGPGVDNDKREKIRQKNEKKHQRQKERRAHELHERCCGYLMSRKLESLSQQLVAMGFPSERATMALILNEGKLEESVAWLFEGGEDSVNQKEVNSDHGGGGNLKVDISHELAQIADMEIKFKCSKQEVERAVVACEGDLAQAAEYLLKFQKTESNATSVPPKPEENGVPPKFSGGTTQMPPPPASHIHQSKQNQAPGAVAVTGRSIVEPGGKNIQLLKKVSPAPSLEKRWAIGGLSPSPSGSYSLTSSLQAAPPLSKTETPYMNIGNELKNLQIGSVGPVREPVIMMQRAQSKHMPATSMSSSSSNSEVEPLTGLNPNRFHTTRGFNINTSSYRTNQLYDQLHYQPRGGVVDYHGGQPPIATNHLRNNRTVGSTSTPPLTAATSLGLFSGFCSNGVSTPSQDWNGDWSSQFDYTNIDWSLNRAPAGGGFIPNVLLMGSGSSPGRTAVRPVASIGGGARLHRPDGVGAGVVGNGGGGGGSEAGGGGGSREWTSPFEEKDLFSLPRQFVSPPSL